MSVATSSADARFTATLRSTVALLRPEQWSKNAFVLAGFIFAHRWAEPGLAWMTLRAFAAFCAASSAAYIFNDWRDRASDRTHPVKKARPFASGALSVRSAWTLGIALTATAFFLAWGAGPRLLVVLFAYLAINALYSLHLKHHVIVDVFSVSSGFMLRLLAGTWAIGIPPSDWMILTGLFLTLFLGFAKRRAEWTDGSTEEERQQRRRVMTSYTPALLDTFLAVCATAAVLCYGLYTVDPATATLHGTSALVYTVPLVLFAIFRYLFLVHRGRRGENPSRDLFTDWQILACAALWALSVIALLL